MQLDGDEVAVGDRVYDTYLGDGIVKNMTADKRIVVVFSGTRMFTYDSRGISTTGRKTLYWHNPVFMTPRKNEVHWDYQKKLCKVVSDFMHDNPAGK